MDTSSPHCRGIPKGLAVHWQAKELAGMSKGIKWSLALSIPCTLKLARMGEVTFPGLPLAEQKVGFSPV